MKRCSAVAALFVLFGILFVDTDGALARRVKRIVNGFPAKTTDFPYQVLVQKVINDTELRERTYTCGGSIISDYWVLTAGHCFNSSFEVENDGVYVITGNDAAVAKNKTARVQVEQVIVHQDFEEAGFKHDIALLKVRSKFEWSDEVKRVEVADASFSLEGTALIPGWGRKTPSGNTSSTLQAAKVALLANKLCQTIFEELPKASHLTFVPETSACVLTVHTGICQGDSGSPLVLRGKQVGVASWVGGATALCTPPFTSVYTRVSHYLEWINKTCDACLTVSAMDPPRASTFSAEAPKPLPKPTSKDTKHRVIITATAEPLPPTKVKLQQSCSGSIVAKNWVLTSALCLDVASTSQVTFWVIPAADFHGNENDTWVKVKQTFIDTVNKQLAVALLETEVEFDWSEEVGPINLNWDAHFEDSATIVQLLVSMEVSGSTRQSDRIANVTTGTSEDCRFFTKRLDQDPSEVLCGSLENLNSDRLTWNAGNAIVDGRGRLVAVAVEHLNSTFPIILTKPTSAYIGWVRETCNCLEMTKEEVLSRFTRVSVSVVLLMGVVGHFVSVRFGVPVFGRNLSR